MMQGMLALPERQAPHRQSLPAFVQSTLLHGLGTALFCVGIAVALALSTGRRFDVQLAYSLGTGMPCWLLIELGRYTLRRPGDFNWPSGWRGSVMVTLSIVVSFFIGTELGDTYSGHSTWAAYTLAPQQFRTAIVITVLAGLAGSFIFYSLGKASLLKAILAQAERDAAQAQRLAAESRLKLLESQIEPHMLFNTLANLRVLIATDPPRAQVMLDYLISYLRATLGASRATTHSLQTEFDRLRNYLELMAIRMGPRLRFNLDLPAALASRPVPALLLQPLVENSIKHGLEPQVAGGSIDVRASLAAGGLTLEVRDDGVGLTPHRAEQKGVMDPTSGFGLQQVQERLATQYGVSASFCAGAAPGGGTRVVITLPILANEA